VRVCGIKLRENIEEGLSAGAYTESEWVGGGGSVVVDFLLRGRYDSNGGWRTRGGWWGRARVKASAAINSVYSVCSSGGGGCIHIIYAGAVAGG